MRRLSAIIVLSGLVCGTVAAASPANLTTGTADRTAIGGGGIILAELVAPIPRRRPDQAGATAQAVPLPRPKPARYRTRHTMPRLLSDTDRAIYRKAFASAVKRGYRSARKLAAKAREPLPAKVIDWTWMRQRASGADFEKIARFIADNPDWPGIATLHRRAEQALTRGIADRRVIEWFGVRSPVSGTGMQRLGEAWQRTGAIAKSVQLLRRAWVVGNFARRNERAFFKRHRRILRHTEHTARLDRLIWEGRRRAASRMLPRVDPATRRLAIARIKVMSSAAGVDAAIARVPLALKSDPGLAYERTRWRRKKNRHESAWEILLAQRPDLGRPDKWWFERQFQIRKLLVKGHVSDAYRVASEHGLSSGADFADAEFLSGWIALRFLHDYDIAFEHFRRLYDNVRYPVSLARGAYWAARAATARGKIDIATSYNRLAAAHPTTFYGQLAALKLRDGDQPEMPPTPTPNGVEKTRFAANELARVIRLLAELGENRRIRPFALRLVELAKTPAEYQLVAALVANLDLPNIGVAVAKRAALNGILLIEYGYPAVAALQHGDRQAEPALLHAVARQESELDPRAVSRAGARGLMQLMPRTAQAIARQLKIGYRRDRLLDDPYYNARLADHYLTRLIKRYDGSYVLALAAYNAGQHRVKRWIRDWGDPRTGEIDPIDWVELIPFEETRNYVQRVLEAVQVYREKFDGDRRSRPLLVKDLTGRGQAGASAGCTATLTFAAQKPRLPC